MVDAIVYLIHTLDTNTSLEERDCASLINCIKQIVQGASVAFAAAVSASTSNNDVELDFD